MRWSTFRRVGALACLVLVGSFAVGCADEDPDKPASAPDTPYYSTPPGGGDSDVFSGPLITLAFSGENPSYHTGILSTPIRIICLDDQKPVCSAESSYDKDFTEQHGIETAKGGDAFDFHGTWNTQTGVLSGRLEVSTVATTDSYTIDYEMQGDLTATRPAGSTTLSGTVKGTSKLTQTWTPEGSGPAVDDTHTIAWSVTGPAPVVDGS